MDANPIMKRTFRSLRTCALGAIAGVLTGILTAGPALAQVDTPVDGPWLPITSIDVTDTTVTVAWNDLIGSIEEKSKTR